MFIATLLIIMPKVWATSVHQQVDIKEMCLYTHTHTYKEIPLSSHKRNIAKCHNMDRLGSIIPVK